MSGNPKSECSPISRLTELSVKNNIPLTFELVDETMTETSTIFGYKAHYGTLCKKGYGTSKKIARHEASSAILKYLGYEVDDNFSFTKTVNFIGKLYEYCRSQKIPLPVYETESATKNDEIPENTYKVKCTIENINILGFGKRAMFAKHEASKGMLEYLQEHDISEKYNEVYEKNKKLLEELNDHDFLNSPHLLKHPNIQYNATCPKYKYP